MEVLVVLLTLLAIYRLTRLIAADTITEPFREWVEEKFTPSSKLTTLVNCHWCVSIYLTFPMSAGTLWWGDERLWQLWIFGLAGSAVAGLFGMIPEPE